MSNQIYPCLWFDGKAREAAELYCSLFKNSRLRDCSQMVCTFELEGQLFMALDGGPQFKPNPTISFFTCLNDSSELEQIWTKLLDGGTVLMPLQKYDWSEQYGWLQDRYGVNWQLNLADANSTGQRITPLLMYCGENQGKAEAAIAFYTSVFPNSETEFVARYEPGQLSLDAKIVHSRFSLNNTPLMAMDSAVPQPFTFSEGVSLVISCETQQEIDYYWDKLTANGEESVCGWCRDQFGVWWQVVPAIIGRLMTDPEKAPRVMQAFMKMKKFEIQTLLEA